MEIRPKQPTAKGPAEFFAGDVWIDPIYNGREPSRARVNVVRFSPSARTAWHSHALGQTLYVTDGVGRVQTRGQATVEIRAGDVVYATADEEHWHGASPDDFMTHLSITEATGDSHKAETDWRAHVTEAEYHGQP